MTVLYVGAGLDVRRTLRVTNDIVVMMDSQPFSEFGKLLCGMKRIDGSDVFSRPKFPSNVAKQLRKHGLHHELDPSNPNVWICRRRGLHVLTYLMNTSLPSDIGDARVSCELREITAIFVSGHHPAGVLMDAIPTRPLQFIGGDGTIFHAHDHDGDDTVVSRLHTDETTRAAFSLFTYHNFHTDGHVHVFTNWFEFTAHARVQNSTSRNTSEHIADARLLNEFPIGNL